MSFLSLIKTRVEIPIFSLNTSWTTRALHLFNSFSFFESLFSAFILSFSFLRSLSLYVSFSLTFAGFLLSALSCFLSLFLCLSAFSFFVSLSLSLSIFISLYPVRYLLRRNSLLLRG